MKTKYSIADSDSIILGAFKLHLDFLNIYRLIDQTEMLLISLSFMNTVYVHIYIYIYIYIMR